jgi:hypothetical protein
MQANERLARSALLLLLIATSALLHPLAEVSQVPSLHLHGIPTKANSYKHDLNCDLTVGQRHEDDSGEKLN